MAGRDATDRPNIVLINCDDLGYGDLGCYGSTTHKTPALDALAAGGMRFTQFYMASPVCSPSRGAMLTGCYPPRIGFGLFEGIPVLFPGQRVGLNPSEITIAGLLKDRGYATKMVGKWHCGDQKEFLPTRHGFDSYYGLPYSNDMGRQVGREKQHPPLPLMRDEEVIEQQPDQRSLTERYVEQCVTFLRDNRERPFFLYVGHMHVHLPLYAAQQFMNSSTNGPYGACVEAIDWSVSVLTHELRGLGLEKNTLVVFTSDNGGRASEGGSNAPLRGNKGTCWEGGMRVPCIMSWPGVIAPAEYGQTITGMDFLPTFAGLAGASAPSDRIIDGKNLGPILKDPTAPSPHNAFFYYMKNDLHAVRDERWKLHLFRSRHAWGEGQAVRELYDLQNDVGETTNVYDQHPDVGERLTKLADSCRRDIGDAATGVVGANCRPIGEVAVGVPLTQYDPNHPYIEAMYDLPQAG